MWGCEHIEIASSERLSLHADGSVYGTRKIEPGGEDEESYYVGEIDDDYSHDPRLASEYSYLLSEWRDYRRHDGEDRRAAEDAYIASRGGSSWSFAL